MIRIYNRAALVVAMTAFGFGASVCSNSPSGNRIMPILVTDKGDQDQLLKALSQPVAMRIRSLLDKRFLACRSIRGEETVFLSANGFAPLVVGPIVTEMNCFGAVVHVLSGGSGLSLVFGDNIEHELGALGFKTIQEIVAVKTDARHQVIDIQVDLDTLGLKPGDVLLLGYRQPGTGRKIINHAVLYLGQRDGQHYFFSKQGIDCGPESTYYVGNLAALLVSKTGQSIYTSVGFDRMIIYRQFAE
ncbi:MAG: hypothetical protein ABIE84_01575 [bacterium]